MLVLFSAEREVAQHYIQEFQRDRQQEGLSHTVNYCRFLGAATKPATANHGVRLKPTSGDAYVAGFSLAGLFDCKRAEAQVSHGVEIIASMAWGARHLSSTQVSHKDLAATISGMDSPGRLGVQDSDQAQAAVRYNRDQAAEKSFYAPKTPNMPKKNVSA